LAHISGIDLDTRPLRGRHKQVGALPARLAGFVADEQRERCVGLTLEQFVHQPYTQKTGRARDEDVFLTVHTETGQVRRSVGAHNM
jgi:hypothetical protein